VYDARMNKLAPLAALLLAACASANAPPKQITEPLPVAPSASPSAGPDIGKPDGKIEEPKLPEPPREAFQPVIGTLDGKPFELRGAGTAGTVLPDGSVQVTLANYPIDCGIYEGKADDRAISLIVPWKEKGSADLGKPSTKAAATAWDEKKKKAAPIRGFRPKGTIEVLSAPNRAKTSGRIKIELTSGKDELKAEIPVRFCFPN
jgi:hypothetical protein